MDGERTMRLVVEGLGPEHLSFVWEEGDTEVLVIAEDGTSRQSVPIEEPPHRPIASYDALCAIVDAFEYLDREGDTDPELEWEQMQQAAERSKSADSAGLL